MIIACAELLYSKNYEYAAASIPRTTFTRFFRQKGSLEYCLLQPSQARD